MDLFESLIMPLGKTSVSAGTNSFPDEIKPMIGFLKTFICETLPTVQRRPTSAGFIVWPRSRTSVFRAMSEPCGLMN